MKNTLKSFGIIALVAVVMYAMTGCEDPTTDSPKSTVVNIAAIQGVTAPVTGGTPVAAITENAQYSGTVTWNGNPATFAAATAYTATITLTVKTGYTLQGVAADFFKVDGATASNAANSGVITAVFPATAGTGGNLVKIDIAAIQGVTAPVTGETPVTAITQTAQYTGTVRWNGSPETFAAKTAYTATITLTAKTGYTLQSVGANFFTVAGATTVNNSANSGVITAIFPETAGMSHGIEMVSVPGGSFQMGKGDGTPVATISPVHTVTLTGFSISKYQVTQAQYLAVMGNNPSSFISDPADGEMQENRPVETVSWYGAIEFCNTLSIQEGLSPYYVIDKDNKDPNNTDTGDTYKWTITLNSAANGYRLPTEAQWEYAAKGGDPSAPGWTGYAFSGSNTRGDVAWDNNNSNSKTHEVGKKAPNGLGIYDMSGNVYEWCWDWMANYVDEEQTNPTGPVSGQYRLIRGGSWNYGTNDWYSVFRLYGGPTAARNIVGLRLVRP
ncbi:MAG: formylglycine-generating enzyme family protein [Treponema sp.]|nr:formylglycine-generating enzyme family protein [Treponema sp.]